MFELVTPSLMAAETIPTAIQSIELNWAILGPILLNALGTIGALAYMFGTTNQRIRVVERDLGRVHSDVGQIQKRMGSADTRIHEMSLVLTKIDTRLDLFLTAARETKACPHYTNALTKVGLITDRGA